MSISANRSYWETELYNQNYDLIVIGAGLTGMSAAYFFKKDHPDANVLVLERGNFPIGASTRNAGFACIGSVGELLSDLEIEEELVLKQRIKDRYEGLLLLRNTLGDENIDYEEAKGCEIFKDQAEFEKAKDSIGIFNQWMDELIGEKEVFSAQTYRDFPVIHNRVEGLLHPGKMIRTLLQNCIGLGVEFRWNSVVENINTDANVITNSNGIDFSADRVIIATNAFTKKLLPEINITPGRGYAFVTSELDSLEWKGGFHFNKGYVYFRHIGENRLLLGGGRNIAHTEETTSEFGVNQSIKNYLVEFANETLELTAGWEIDHEWSGIMGFTDTKKYLLEKISPRCVLAAGLSGMGVALGMNFGKKAASLI